jgi:hypothetical protein
MRCPSAHSPWTDASVRRASLSSPAIRGLLLLEQIVGDLPGDLQGHGLAGLPVDNRIRDLITNFRRPETERPYVLDDE